MRKEKIANSQVREVDALFTDIADSREGCLLDNYIGYAEGKLIAVFEKYETCWTSGYLLCIADTAEEDREVWTAWDEFCKDYDAEYGEEEEDV